MKTRRWPPNKKKIGQKKKKKNSKQTVAVYKATIKQNQNRIRVAT